MPELPEIEVLRLSLERLLPGDHIAEVAVHAPRLREDLDAAALAALGGREIVGLRRRAKYLLVDLSGGRTLVVHLGMSGRFTLVPREEPLAKHEHLGFQLRSGRRLRLVDPRRFGLAFVVATADLEEDPHFRRLGPEPLGPAFDGPYLAALAAKRQSQLKSFVMDGQVVVGVGNIYACEALWRAELHPARTVAGIAETQWQNLAAAIRAVLAQAIGEGGTTLNDFADGEGNSGYFQVSLAVYGRTGEPCPRCGTPIQRQTLAQRGTFFCPSCQR